MLILGLDSSAKAASSAVYDTDSNTLIAYGGVNVKITHSETLLPLVESVLEAAKLNLSSIGAFAVTAGPGSFTGVRIAAGAVKGMAFALGLPVYPVSTLRCLAYNLIGRDCAVCCVMDARRGQFYNALFRIKGQKVIRLTPDSALCTAEIEDELRICESEKIILAGDGAELFLSETKLLNVECAPVTLIHQSAASVCLAAAEEKPVSAKELIPIYLRLPQAERERKYHKEGVQL